MNLDYGTNLDLNLLRVFAVVAEQGSVTAAASRLYLSQPAVSAALRRLRETLGGPVFARHGRGLALTNRGVLLLAAVQPLLRALTEAALSPAAFDPATAERTLRVGLSDACEGWLLPPLLRALEREAPGLRIIAVPVQFRTVAEQLANGNLDAAVTVADELPTAVRRQRLLGGGFVCLFDPRHAGIKLPLGETEYFTQQHVIVSYNGDLRGLVEDSCKKTRRVRCSVASFHSIGCIVEGSGLLATIPAVVAAHICRMHPHLRTTPLPFRLEAQALELLWPLASDDDPAGAFVRAKLSAIAKTIATSVREQSKPPKKRKGSAQSAGNSSSRTR